MDNKKMNMSEMKPASLTMKTTAEPLGRTGIVKNVVSNPERHLGVGTHSLPKNYTTIDKAVPFPGAKKP